MLHAKISVWMLQNKLRIKTDKTEFIIFYHLLSSIYSLSKLPDVSLHVGEKSIKLSDFVKYLGMYINKVLNFINYHKQTSTVGKIGFYHLRNIQRIISFQTEKSSKTLTKTSRLEHNNSLLFGVQTCLTNKVQRVQNCAAHLVTNTSKFDHISPILKILYWLPVHVRIQFKVLLMDYICDMLHPVTSKYRLRYANRYQLHTPRTNLVSVGDRAYNKLPVNIKNANTIHIFKHLLKTHFLKMYL